MTALPCPRCGRSRRYGTGGVPCSRCRYVLRGRRPKAKQSVEAAPPRFPLLFERREFDRLGNAEGQAR